MPQVFWLQWFSIRLCLFHYHYINYVNSNISSAPEIINLSVQISLDFQDLLVFYSNSQFISVLFSSSSFPLFFNGVPPRFTRSCFSKVGSWWWPEENEPRREVSHSTWPACYPLRKKERPLKLITISFAGYIRFIQYSATPHAQPTHRQPWWSWTYFYIYTCRCVWDRVRCILVHFLLRGWADLVFSRSLHGGVYAWDLQTMMTATPKDPFKLPLPYISFKPATWWRCTNCLVQRQPRHPSLRKKLRCVVSHTS